MSRTFGGEKRGNNHMTIESTKVTRASAAGYANHSVLPRTRRLWAGTLQNMAGGRWMRPALGAAESERPSYCRRVANRWGRNGSPADSAAGRRRPRQPA
eukprot:scaffold105688_cov32-Tisochrysis_lutea.AAC.3